MRIRIRLRFWWNKWIASRQLKFARRFDKKKKKVFAKIIKIMKTSLYGLVF